MVIFNSYVKLPEGMFYELCPIFDSNFQISPRGNNCEYFAGHSRAAFSTYDYKWSLSS